MGVQSIAIALSFGLLLLGLLAALLRTRRSLALLGVQLMFAAAVLAFVLFGRAHVDPRGASVAWLILGVAVAHAALGFAIRSAPTDPNLGEDESAP